MPISHTVATDDELPEAEAEVEAGKNDKALPSALTVEAEVETGKNDSAVAEDESSPEEAERDADVGLHADRIVILDGSIDARVTVWLVMTRSMLWSSKTSMSRVWVITVGV